MPAPFDLKETDRLLSTTRAVRKRLDLERPVERSVLLDCIRLSMQAPTGSNSQSWRWMIVTDAAKRAELARLYREVGDQYLEMARKNVPAGDAIAAAHDPLWNLYTGRRAVRYWRYRPAEIWLEAATGRPARLGDPATLLAELDRLGVRWLVVEEGSADLVPGGAEAIALARRILALPDAGARREQVNQARAIVSASNPSTTFTRTTVRSTSAPKSRRSSQPARSNPN